DHVGAVLVDRLLGLRRQLGEHLLLLAREQRLDVGRDVHRADGRALLLEVVLVEVLLVEVAPLVPHRDDREALAEHDRDGVGDEEPVLVGPWEPVAPARDYGAYELELVTVGPSYSLVRLRGGLRVVPDHAFVLAPPADLIVVPGGPGTRDEPASEGVVEWL